MNIKLNKDFEREYPDDVWKGFTKRQTLTIALAAALGSCIIVGIWYLTGIRPYYCVYLGMPVIAGILFGGFKQYQGMYLEEYIKELIFEWKTRQLSYEADELDEQSIRTFTTECVPKFGTERRKR